MSTDPAVFTLTPAAVEQILRSSTQHADAPALRVAAKRSEDGGIVYGMGFDEQREQDEVIECEGVTVLIGPLSRDLLQGTTLDFVELAPGEFQFVFINPNDDAARAGQAGNSASQ